MRSEKETINKSTIDKLYLNFSHRVAVMNIVYIYLKKTK